MQASLNSQQRLWARERRRCFTIPWNFWRLAGLSNNLISTGKAADCLKLFCLKLVPFSLAGVGMLNAGCAYHGVSSMAVDDPWQYVQELCHPFRITHVFSISEFHCLFGLHAGCISPENGCAHQYGTYVPILFCSLPQTLKFGIEELFLLNLGWQTCWNWKRVATFLSSDSKPFYPAGFCWGKAIGARIHSMAGSAMLLLDIHVSRIWNFIGWCIAKGSMTDIQQAFEYHWGPEVQHTGHIGGRKAWLFCHNHLRLSSCHMFRFSSCHPQISQPQLQETCSTQVWNWETGFAGECVTCVLAVAIPEKLRGVYLHCIG